MTSLSRSEFTSFIETTLPDNSNREISASDLRSSFLNLADSLGLLNNDVQIVSLNMGTIDTRSVYAGDESLIRKSSNGFLSEDNTAVGYASLQFSYTASRNTGLGSYALSCNSMGSDNVGVGVNSVGGTTTGSGNIGVGNYTLMSNKTGNFNIAVGHGAGYLSETDDEFKFYLGVYPDASGDCDTSHVGLNKSPLLYGDLKTLQLAIGASGFRGSEKLAVSGDIIPYESGVNFSLGSGEYRWNAHVEDLYISGSVISQTPLHQLYISDGESAADLIASAETVTVSGISGIKTDYDASSNLMRVSAHPVSGWAKTTIEHYADVSGVAVSGWSRAYTDAVAAAAGSFTKWIVADQEGNSEDVTNNTTVLFSGISGIASEYDQSSNIMKISSHPISGWAQNTIENYANSSGVAVSGWSKSYTDFNVVDVSGFALFKMIEKDAILNGSMITRDSAVSGWADSTILHYANISGVAISGWATSVSGYFEDNFIKSIPGGTYSKWIMTDGENSKNIENLQTIEFSGISGISTNFRLDNAQLEISAEPLSGWVGYNLTSISGDNGLIDTKIATANDSIRSDLDAQIAVIHSQEGLSGTLYHTITNASGNLQSQITDNDLKASGFIESLSGLMDYDFYNELGINHRVSGWNKLYTDNQIQQLTLDVAEDNYGHWKISDGVNSKVIDARSSVNFFGNNGLETTATGSDSPYSLTVDAAPISGYLEGLSASITGTQGCFETKIQAVSGWADYNQNYISGVNGLASGAITTEKIALSGWTSYKLNAISGVDGTVDQAIDSASGWNKFYTDQEITALTLASDSYVAWKISDGTTTKNISSLQETQFLGVSGIDTFTKTGGSSGIYISAKPLSGVLRSIITNTGQAAISEAYSTAISYANNQDLISSGWAQSTFTSNDSRASGLISVNDARTSGLIAVNDARASGLVSLTSGNLTSLLSTSAGSGLVKIGQEFNTSGSGNFDRVILNKSGTHPSGQVVADSGFYHDIVNSSGFLTVPVYSKLEDVELQINPVSNSGAIAFAGGQVRVSNGLRWHRPPVIEGFMQDDLLPPTDYLNPTSGRIVTRNENFLASEVYYVTNRDHTFAASGGYYLMAMLVNNEYRPTWSTCSGCPAC